MIKIEDLIMEDQVNEYYRIPGTKVLIWEGNLTGRWFLEIPDEKPAPYSTKQEALNAYNQSLTPVLPPDTDIIDLHKIE